MNDCDDSSVPFMDFGWHVDVQTMAGGPPRLVVQGKGNLGASIRDYALGGRGSAPWRWRSPDVFRVAGVALRALHQQTVAVVTPAATLRYHSTMRSRIEILDTTLRDGGKLPFSVLSVRDRVLLARRLERLGVDVIEVGAPASSPDEAECVAAVAAECESAYVSALCRPVAAEVERTLDILGQGTRPYLHLSMPLSPYALAAVVQRAPADVVADVRACVATARDAGVRVQFGAGEAAHADRGFLAAVIAACREGGADVVNLADTNGVLSPEEMRELVQWAIGQAGPEGPAIGVHCHNDLGLASANTLAAVSAGARHVEVTLGGVGERAGNASLEEVAMQLEAFGARIGVTHGIRLDELWGAARLLDGLTGIRPHPNRAVTGECAMVEPAGFFARRSLEPRLRALLDGRTIGHAAGGPVERLAELETEPSALQLDAFSVQTGSGAPPVGVVSIMRGSSRLVQSSHGAGPIDALYRAVDRAIGFSPKLVFYSLHTLATGPEAPAEVTVTIEQHGRRFHGRYASADVIEASLRAYLAACDAAVVAALRPGAEFYVHGEYLWE
jgi:2-isopropylmalate synthase